MTDLIFTTKLEIYSQTKGALSLIINGKLYQRTEFDQSTDVGISTPRQYDPKGPWYIKSIAEIESVSGQKPDHYSQIIQTGVAKQKADITISPGTNTQRLTWNPRFIETNPTYLETLDKLDQWSHAQYIPNSMNELKL